MQITSHLRKPYGAIFCFFTLFNSSFFSCSAECCFAVKLQKCFADVPLTCERTTEKSSHSVRVDVHSFCTLISAAACYKCYFFERVYMFLLECEPEQKLLSLLNTAHSAAAGPPTPHHYWQHSLKELFVFQIDGGFQTPVVFCLSTYFNSLSLTTGWGLIPGIYLSGLAANLTTLLKTYFNEMPVRRNNNLYRDVLIGFEVELFERGEGSLKAPRVPLRFEQRLKTDAWPQQWMETRMFPLVCFHKLAAIRRNRPFHRKCCALTHLQSKRFVSVSLPLVLLLLLSWSSCLLFNIAHGGIFKTWLYT